MSLSLSMTSHRSPHPIPHVPPAACVAGREIWVRVVDDDGGRRECGKIVGVDRESGEYEVFIDNMVIQDFPGGTVVASNMIHRLAPGNLALLDPDGFEMLMMDGTMPANG